MKKSSSMLFAVLAIGISGSVVGSDKSLVAKDSMGECEKWATNCVKCLPNSKCFLDCLPIESLGAILYSLENPLQSKACIIKQPDRVVKPSKLIAKLPISALEAKIKIAEDTRSLEELKREFNQLHGEYLNLYLKCSEYLTQNNMSQPYMTSYVINTLQGEKRELALQKKELDMQCKILLKERDSKLGHYNYISPKCNEHDRQGYLYDLQWQGMQIEWLRKVAVSIK